MNTHFLAPQIQQKHQTRVLGAALKEMLTLPSRYRVDPEGDVLSILLPSHLTGLGPGPVGQF